MTIAQKASLDQSTTKSTLILILGDWLVLTLFVLIGQVDHEMVGANPLPRLLSTTAELAVPWMIVGLLLGAFRYSNDWHSFLGRFVVAWLVAAPLALLLRAYMHNQASIIVVFMTVAIGIGGGMLLAWRLVYWLIRRRGQAS
jgi:hypothetical protein